MTFQPSFHLKFAQRVLQDTELEVKQTPFRSLIHTLDALNIAGLIYLIIKSIFVLRAQSITPLLANYDLFVLIQYEKTIVCLKLSLLQVFYFEKCLRGNSYRIIGGINLYGINLNIWNIISRFLINFFPVTYKIRPRGYRDG